MKKISRKLALINLAIDKIAKCSEQEIDNILFADYIDQNGKPIEYTCYYDDKVQDFLLCYFLDIELKGYSNQYIQRYLLDLFHEPFNIIGNEDILKACPCCNYLTLPKRAEYDICPVCYWEDDGKPNDDLDTYSSVNHSTLKNYKKQFSAKKLDLINIPYTKNN